jgi:hypothetical protein
MCHGDDAKSVNRCADEDRLVLPLSFEEAAALNTAFLRDAADNLGGVAAFASVTGWMAFAPAGSEWNHQPRAAVAPMFTRE